jgi:hypothetical protein
MKNIFRNRYRNKLEIYNESKNKVLWSADPNGVNLKLLMFGQSNWNFYYDVESYRVISIVKKGVQCSESNWCFGSVSEFSKFLRRIGGRKGFKNSLTKLGHLVLNYGIEKPDVLSALFEHSNVFAHEAGYEEC